MMQHLLNVTAPHGCATCSALPRDMFAANLSPAMCNPTAAATLKHGTAYWALFRGAHLQTEIPMLLPPSSSAAFSASALGLVVAALLEPLLGMGAA